VENRTDDVIFNLHPGGKLGLIEFHSFHADLNVCSNVILSANKFIRKMRGSSQ